VTLTGAYNSEASAFERGFVADDTFDIRHAVPPFSKTTYAPDVI